MDAPGDSIRVRRATPRDGALIADILAGAFVTDPFFSWMWSTDPVSIRTGVAAWMRLVVHRVAARADVWLTLDETAAVVWIRPDRPLEAADYAAVGALLDDRLGLRADDIMAAIAGPASRVPDVGHATLLYVGVRPEAQGHGRGTAVVAPGLAATDASGLPVHLNSTHPRNQPFYERLGFVPLGAAVVTGMAPPIQPMWRPARPPAG